MTDRLSPAREPVPPGGAGPRAESPPPAESPPRAECAAAAARVRRAERRGWSAVAAVTAAVAATWAPMLGMPFGDNHLGRIVGRYALHLSNLQERGLLGSHFGADWAPYASAPYAHHPPLLNLLTALTGSLPGDGEYQVWLPPYLLALLVIPAGAALLRGFGVGWAATLLAVGLMVATPFYWVYSPLMFDLGPILALSATVVRLRRRPDPPRRLLAAGTVAALLTTLVSWPGIAFAAGIGWWLLAGRHRVDRVAIVLGAGMLAGLAISLGYVIGVTGMADLGGQAELRSGSGDGYTARQFLRRQWQYAWELLPLWYLLGLPAAVAAGLLDRRTRGYTAMATAFTAGWVLLLNNGAYVHSYWSYPILVPGLVGMGVLLDRLAGRLPAARTTGPVLAGLALAAYLGTLVLGPTGRRQLAEPARAGRLVAEHRPPSSQRYAWVAGEGLTSPRWLTYYWRLSPRNLDAGAPVTDAARPDDLVLMDLRRPPDWLPETVGRRAVARNGPYALFRLADLHAARR